MVEDAQSTITRGQISARYGTDTLTALRIAYIKIGPKMYKNGYNTLAVRNQPQV